MPGGYEANQIGSAVPATAGAGALCVSSVMESNPRRPRTAASANLRQISTTRNRPSPSSSRKAGEKKTKRSRGAPASEFCQVLRSQFASPRKTEGSGAPKGASNQCPRVFRARKRAKCRGALAFRRSAAALATPVATSIGSAPEPRFLGPLGRVFCPPPPITNAVSSSQTGPSAGRAGPQSRPGTEQEPVQSDKYLTNHKNYQLAEPSAGYRLHPGSIAGHSQPRP
jgi:hypothetical protein